MPTAMLRTISPIGLRLYLSRPRGLGFDLRQRRLNVNDRDPARSQKRRDHS
jgi:hypothetical protein